MGHFFRCYSIAKQIYSQYDLIFIVDNESIIPPKIDVEKYSINMDVTQAQWVFVDGDMDVSSVGRRDVIYSEDLTVNFSDLNSDQGITGILLGDVNGTI